MANGKKTFKCVGPTKDNPTAVPNYIMVPSKVQTLQFDVVGDDNKVTKYKAKREMLVTKNAKGEEVYRFQRKVAIPKLTRSNSFEELAVNLRAYADAIEDYDSSETVTSQTGATVAPRLVLVSANTKGKAIPVLDCIQNAVEEAIRLNVQQAGQKARRPIAIATIAKEQGLTLPAKGERGKGKDDSATDAFEEPDFSEE